MLAKGYSRTSGYYGRFAPLGQEQKFLDTSSNTGAVTTTGQILPSSLVTVAAGSGESQRIGRKITVRALHLRFVAGLNSQTTGNNTDDGLRVIVYLDKQCNGATATVTDILETADYLSFNNLANKNRFMVLMDKHVDVSATCGAYNGTTNIFGSKAVTKSMHKKLNVPIEFSSTTGGLTEIRSNNLGVLVISDKGNIQYTATARIRYTDN